MIQNISQNIAITNRRKPIVIIGAGGIVKDAHLPAYHLAGFNVIGIFDIDYSKAEKIAIASNQKIKAVKSLDELIELAEQQKAIYDIAVPAKFLVHNLKQLPTHSAVLMQKPMGETIEEAKQILKICEENQLTAAVNLQLKFAPFSLLAKKLIDQNILGEIYDIELMVNVFTPWHLWSFLEDIPRVEILYHSIHYLDLIRSFIGMPSSLYAQTIQHPKMKRIAATRSSIIMNYAHDLQARIITNHGHEFGRKHQYSYLKIEGTKGAIQIKIGLSLNYPTGEPPTFEYFIIDQHAGWQEIKLEGGWFPHAFIGPMASLQNHLHDSSKPLQSTIYESFNTMVLVETSYESNNKNEVIKHFNY